MRRIARMHVGSLCKTPYPPLIHLNQARGQQFCALAYDPYDPSLWYKAAQTLCLWSVGRFVGIEYLFLLPRHHCRFWKHRRCNDKK